MNFKCHTALADASTVHIPLLRRKMSVGIKERMKYRILTIWLRLQSNTERDDLQQNLLGSLSALDNYTFGKMLSNQKD